MNLKEHILPMYMIAYQNEIGRTDDVLVKIFQSVTENVDGDAMENLVK